MAGAKILIVEDDATLTELVSIVLTREGFTVKVNNDGATALDTAAMWQPDLILLDVMMPGMHGYTVTEKLRAMAATAKTPIIMLTAKQSIQDKARGFEAGVDDYITKPFDNTELVLRVRALLRHIDIQAPSTEESTQPARTLVFFSLRGGSGCTSLAANVATGLSLMWRQPVTLLDFALPIGSCDVLLNLKPRNNLGSMPKQDYAQLDYADIESFMVQHKSGLRFLGGVTHATDAELVTEELASFLIGRIQPKCHYLVIDTSHSFAGPNLAALERADVIVMPVTPDVASVRMTLGALNVLEEIHIKREKVRLILNATFSESGLESERIEKVLGHSIDRVILHEDAWTKAVNFGRPVIQTDPNSTLVTTLETLVWDLSTDADREKEPDIKSDMWKRVQRRVRQRRPVQGAAGR